jgi:hypothetical protein
MSGNVPFTGPGGIGNEFVSALTQNETFRKFLDTEYGPDALAKADTISQSTNLLWYDLSPVVQMLYPYRELIPRISRLPRVAADGGNSYHWKRIVAINPNGMSSGVSEGNRGGRIPISEQDQMATFKTVGYESSVTFEARLAGRNLSPETLGISVQSSLRSLMIDEEKLLINGDANLPLGITPTPTLSAGAAGGGNTGSFSGGTVYVRAVALTGMGIANYSPYNAATGTGGVLGQITRINADGSSDTYGGGSAQPSAEASVGTSSTQIVTATVASVVGAMGYAWFIGSASGAEYLAGISPSTQAVFTKFPNTATAQPVTSLQVGGNYQDNSINFLTPDGILNQVFGNITGPAPGTQMATAATLPANVTLSPSGSLVYSCPNGNTGLTINGVNINEFDSILRAAYDQYKIGFDRILISSVDMLNSFGAMMSQSGTSNIFRLFFENNEKGQLVAGYKITSYINKFFGNTLDVELHPYIPPGTILFWSDRSPYELSGVGNILEARVRQDYYQIQWPWRSRRYEYGVYADEVFPCYFTPGFAVINNVNPTTGNFAF